MKLERDWKSRGRGVWWAENRRIQKRMEGKKAMSGSASNKFFGLDNRLGHISKLRKKDNKPPGAPRRRNNSWRSWRFIVREMPETWINPDFSGNYLLSVNTAMRRTVLDMHTRA